MSCFISNDKFVIVCLCARFLTSVLHLHVKQNQIDIMLNDQKLFFCLQSLVCLMAWFYSIMKSQHWYLWYLYKISNAIFFPVAGLFGGFVPFLLASSLPVPHLPGYNKVMLEYSCKKNFRNSYGALLIFSPRTKKTYIRKQVLLKYDSIP